jgi:tetratricopeptide (TPR) repeat protein
MDATTDILRGELERLYTLDEMTAMSKALLALEPVDVGGVDTKATFARALAERCVSADRIEALLDVLEASRRDLDPRVRELGSLIGRAEAKPGQSVGAFMLARKIGEGDLGTVFAAERVGGALDELDEGGALFVKVLHAEATRDGRALQRFLTANRLLADVKHAGLSRLVEAGESDAGAFIAYASFDGQSLAQRLSRTGPSHINELRPILRGILEPLAALHAAHRTHGALRLENVLIGRVVGAGGASGLRVGLIDAGTDRLRLRIPPFGGVRSGGALSHARVAITGSGKGLAPEQLRGLGFGPRADVYAFGAMMYELVSGKPVFAVDAAGNGVDTSFAPLVRDPEPPSAKAPRGWVPRDVDVFVLSLLSKDPDLRPRDARAVLDALDALARGNPLSSRAPSIPPEQVGTLIDRLAGAPDDADAAMALEAAVEEAGGEATKIAEAFLFAAETLEGSVDHVRETKKSLLYRAARTYENTVDDKAKAEGVYRDILAVDPTDGAAENALVETCKKLGKYEEVIELLLARSQAATAGDARARAMAEIGRLCASELDDKDQALVAYGQALAENPGEDAYAREIESLAADDPKRWGEVLAALTEAARDQERSSDQRNALMIRGARWYDVRPAAGGGRSDMALLAYKQVLVTDPANELANEGLTELYRKAQDWKSLAAVLLKRAEAAGPLPRGRDLRAEAADVLEVRLGDVAQAKTLYVDVLGHDPAHAKASDALIRMAEKEGDFRLLAQLLERRADAKRGPEKVDALARVAEVYEDSLSDLPEALRRYEAVLLLDRTHLGALKGLDRIFNRTGRYRDLLDNLARQVGVAASPRQRINLYERISALEEEEFLEHAKAIEAREAILAIEPTNDAALTALPRLYRGLGRWEEVVRVLERHAALVEDQARKAELTLARARVLAEQIGSPERAMQAYEEALRLAPDHPQALEALARLRETSGDAQAALTAVEALAAQATTPEGKAEQWIRAARLLEGRGDKDGAIVRYKLALEATPNDANISLALRRAYEERGEAAEVVALLERELTVTEGNLAKARLLAELAKVQREKLHDDVRAEECAKKAHALDATNVDALTVLGDIAFENQRYMEASKLFEALLGRTQLIAKTDAIRVLSRYVEAFWKSSGARISLPGDGGPTSGVPVSGVPTSAGSGTHPRVTAAVDELRKLAPDDLEVLEGIARISFDFGDPKMAEAAYGELLEKAKDGLSRAERATALFRRGESARRAGDLAAAITHLRDSADLDPNSPLALDALAKVYEKESKWEDLVRAKRSRLELAVPSERFDLLLEIGDLEFQKLNDRRQAQKTLASALEERPDDRKLLTKLMQLYSEEKDWQKLVEVVLKLAEFVEDRQQRAKYLHTAAIVSWRQIGELDNALTFYERALDFDPTLTKALDEATDLCRQKGDHAGVERFLNRQLEKAKEANDRTKLVVVLKQLGELYRTSLSEPEMAIDAYEAAQAFDPDDKSFDEILADLYASDVKNYLDKAVRAQAQMLRTNPYRVESYKLLRRLYTESKRADAAWCLCQALGVLNLAEPDEERFYRRHLAQDPAAAQAVLTEDDWAAMSHADVDPLLTRIFAIVQPVIIRARTQPLEQTGVDRRYAIDLTQHPYAISQTLHYAAGVLGMQAPLVFQNPNDPGGLGFLHAHEPSIVLGRAAFDPNFGTQPMAFVAGRHLTYYRPGFYVRHLVPTGTGLKAWLFAAIKLSAPQFPIAPELEGQVQEATAAMNAAFQGVERELLASQVSKLLQGGTTLDLKKWVASIDLTADRAGMLLAHNLESAAEVMRATEDAASVPGKDRMKEIVLFSISEPYLQLRQKLGIAIDS